MFDLDSLIANKDLILKDLMNKADITRVMSVPAELNFVQPTPKSAKSSGDSPELILKTSWQEIFDAYMQGIPVVLCAYGIEESSANAYKYFVTGCYADQIFPGVSYGIQAIGVDSSLGAGVYQGTVGSPESCPVLVFNAIESGGGGASALLVQDIDGTLDKKFSEIKAAFPLVYSYSVDEAVQSLSTSVTGTISSVREGYNEGGTSYDYVEIVSVMGVSDYYVVPHGEDGYPTWMEIDPK